MDPMNRPDLQSRPDAPQPRVAVISPDGRRGTMDAAEFPQYEAQGWARYHEPGAVTSDSQTPVGGGALRRNLDALGGNAFQPVLTGLAGATATHLFGVKDPEATEGEGFWKTYNRFKHRQQRDSMEMDKESPALRPALKVAGDLGVMAGLTAAGVGPLASVVGQSGAEWAAQAPGDIVSDEGQLNPKAAGESLARGVTGAGVGAGAYGVGKYVVGPIANKVGGMFGNKAAGVSDDVLNNARFGKGGGYAQQASQQGSYRESLTEEKRALERLFADQSGIESGAIAAPQDLALAVRTAARSNAVQQAAARSAAANIEQLPSKLSRPGIEREALAAINPEQIAQEIHQQTLAPGAALRGVGRFAGRWLTGPAIGAGVGYATNEITENSGLAGGAGGMTAAMFMRPGVKRSAQALLASPSVKFNTLRILQAALTRDPTMTGRIVGTVAQNLLHPHDDPQEAAVADHFLSQTEPAYRMAKREEQEKK